MLFVLSWCINCSITILGLSPSPKLFYKTISSLLMGCFVYAVEGIRTDMGALGGCPPKNSACQRIDDARTYIYIDSQPSTHHYSRCCIVSIGAVCSKS